MKWLFVLLREKLRGKLVAMMHKTHPDTPACLLGLVAAKCGSAHTAAGADTDKSHRTYRGNPPRVTKKGVPDEDVSVYSASPSTTCLLISQL